MLFSLQAAASVSRVGHPTRGLHAAGLFLKNDVAESGEPLSDTKVCCLLLTWSRADCCSSTRAWSSLTVCSKRASVADASNMTASSCRARASATDARMRAIASLCCSAISLAVITIWFARIERRGEARRCMGMQMVVSAKGSRGRAAPLETWRMKSISPCAADSLQAALRWKQTQCCWDALRAAEGSSHVMRQDASRSPLLLSQRRQRRPRSLLCAPSPPAIH